VTVSTTVTLSSRSHVVPKPRGESGRLLGFVS
jgi:hypothetical protein